MSIADQYALLAENNQYALPAKNNEDKDKQKGVEYENTGGDSDEKVQY